jgi:hypothetical protein
MIDAKTAAAIRYYSVTQALDCRVRRTVVRLQDEAKALHALGEMHGLLQQGPGRASCAPHGNAGMGEALIRRRVDDYARAVSA